MGGRGAYAAKLKQRRSIARGGREFAQQLTDGERLIDVMVGGVRSGSSLDEVEDSARIALESLSVDEIKDVIKKDFLDPNHMTRKWVRKDRLINHAMEVAHSRMIEGDAYRRV